MNSPQTLGGWLKEAVTQLEEEGVKSPLLSARLIIEEATGYRRTKILAFPEIAIEETALKRANELLARRLLHEPMAYILGQKEFRDLTLHVSPNVLIPRPETEEMIDAVLSFGIDPKRILDTGTGSGCLALSLAREFPRATTFGCDRSEGALSVCRQNDPDRRVRWVRADWLEPFAANAFDLIVSNPPYLTAEEMKTLDPQIANYEPTGALSGGRDGCDAYRFLVPQAYRCLAPGGVLILEGSPTVASKMAEVLESAGFERVEVRRDLAGKERFAVGWRVTR